MTTEEIHSIALRYFSGQTLPDEERLLMAYLEEKEQHKEEFRHWERDWLLTHKASPATEAAWQQLSERIEKADQEKRKPARLRVVRRWLARAAAAVVLIALGATAHYYIYRPAESYYTSIAPAGSKSCVVLPDSSKVWLNAGSRLTYSTRFGEKDRRVELDGQGYFEVSRRDGKTFTVSTRGYEVVVRGTKFDVRAYSDEPRVSTTLFSGRVDICQDGEVAMPLKPGEAAIYDLKSQQLRKTTAMTDAHGWVSGNIDFDDIAFSDLARILNRQYDVNIHTNSPKVANMRLSVSLHNDETIGDIVEALRQLGNLKVKRKGKDILVE